MTSQVVDIQESNQGILRKGVVIVDFFATWCGPCKRLAPSFSEYASGTPNVTFAKVDGDENEDLMVEFNVRAFPTLMLLVNGKVVDTIEGCDKSELAELVAKASSLAG
jgi:thioredoxin